MSPAAVKQSITRHQTIQPQRHSTTSAFKTRPQDGWERTTKTDSKTGKKVGERRGHWEKQARKKDHEEQKLEFKHVKEKVTEGMKGRKTFEEGKTLFLPSISKRWTHSAKMREKQGDVVLERTTLMRTRAVIYSVHICISTDSTEIKLSWDICATSSDP